MNQINKMPERKPTNGTFELTVRCNLHCKMCLFRHDDSENKEIINKEFTAEQWIDMAAQVARAGTINLLITGGEPMLRSDFCEIWEGIYKQGFLITLYTNATLVSDKIMECLRKYPPHIIGITIYGSNENIYEKVCGNSKAFKKMVSGIHQLMKLPSKVTFRSTIIKDNYDDVENIERFLLSEFNISEPIQQPRCVLPAVRGGSANVQAVRLSPKENVDLFFRRGINKIKQRVGEDKFNPDNIRIQLESVASEENLSKKKNIHYWDARRG